MSIRRLCVRISKCSRESLSLNGERITQYTFFSVGSGTGPDTLAPVRVAVSTISFAADSIADVSYAFRRMRILFCVAAAMVWGFRVLGCVGGVALPAGARAVPLTAGAAADLAAANPPRCTAPAGGAYKSYRTANCCSLRARRGGGYYVMISLTTPEPTVRPPSRMAKRSP